MIPRVTVYQEAKLLRIVYVFWLDEYTMTLVLDEYREENRPSRRHNWRVEDQWSRLSSRNRTAGYIRREDIQIPELIRQAAWNEFTGKITVEE